MELIETRDFVELIKTLYNKLDHYLITHEPEERIRKKYPDHSLFCECNKCLLPSRKQRKMLAELRDSMGVHYG